MEYLKLCCKHDKLLQLINDNNINILCSKCNTMKPFNEMSPLKRGNINTYLYCKKCVNIDRNKYRKNKREERGLKERGPKGKKLDLTYNDEFHKGVTFKDIQKITNINVQVLRNIYRGKIKRKHKNIIITDTN